MLPQTRAALKTLLAADGDGLDGRLVARVTATLSEAERGKLLEVVRIVFGDVGAGDAEDRQWLDTAAPSQQADIVCREVQAVSKAALIRPDQLRPA